jgi:Tfp pilus assembly protein PilN
MSQQINLFDPSLRERRPPLDAATMAIAFVLVAGALLGFHQYALHRLKAAQAQAESASAQLKQLQAHLAQLGAAAKRAPSKTLQEDIDRAETTARNWQQLAGRLNGSGIGNTQGHARFLEALARQHADGVWLTDIAVSDGGEFALRGRMLRPESLGGYIELLNREEALRGRAIGQLKIAEKEAQAGNPGKGKRVPEDQAAVRFVEFSIGSAVNAADAGGAR